MKSDNTVHNTKKNTMLGIAIIALSILFNILLIRSSIDYCSNSTVCLLETTPVIQHYQSHLSQTSNNNSKIERILLNVEDSACDPLVDNQTFQHTFGNENDIGSAFTFRKRVFDPLFIEFHPRRRRAQVMYASTGSSHERLSKIRTISYVSIGQCRYTLALPQNVNLPNTC